MGMNLTNSQLKEYNNNNRENNSEPGKDNW